MPAATSRPAAPTGLGSDGNAVWYSAPAPEAETIARWYVNGALAARKTGQYANSATLAELGAQAGDVVQVCIEAGGIVGWWGRVAV